MTRDEADQILINAVAEKYPCTYKAEAVVDLVEKLFLRVESLDAQLKAKDDEVTKLKESKLELAKNEFILCKKACGDNNLQVWLETSYFAYFLHGWLGRTNNAQYQIPVPENVPSSQETINDKD